LLGFPSGGLHIDQRKRSEKFFQKIYEKPSFRIQQSWLVQSSADSKVNCNFSQNIKWVGAFRYTTASFGLKIA
jgi:hypothetical protein